MKREQIIKILESKFVTNPLSNYSDCADAILALFEQKESKSDLKDELIMFLKWYKKLSPSDKCTVHPPAGSGGCYGLYNLSNEDLIDKYLKQL